MQKEFTAAAFSLTAESVFRALKPQQLLSAFLLVAQSQTVRFFFLFFFFFSFLLLEYRWEQTWSHPISMGEAFWEMEEIIKWSWTKQGKLKWNSMNFDVIRCHWFIHWLRLALSGVGFTKPWNYVVICYLYTTPAWVWIIHFGLFCSHYVFPSQLWMTHLILNFFFHPWP